MSPALSFWELMLLGVEHCGFIHCNPYTSNFWMNWCVLWSESFVCWIYLRERVFDILNRRIVSWIIHQWLPLTIEEVILNTEGDLRSSQFYSVKSIWANSISVIHSSCKWIWTGQKNKKDESAMEVSDFLIPLLYYWRGWLVKGTSRTCKSRLHVVWLGCIKCILVLNDKTKQVYMIRSTEVWFLSWCPVMPLVIMFWMCPHNT